MNITGGQTDRQHHLCSLNCKVLLLITNCRPELNPLKCNLIHLRLHCLKSDLKGGGEGKGREGEEKEEGGDGRKGVLSPHNSL